MANHTISHAPTITMITNPRITTTQLTLNHVCIARTITMNNQKIVTNRPAAPVTRTIMHTLAMLAAMLANVRPATAKSAINMVANSITMKSYTQ
ncbi:MAG: hypothetical protein ACRC46_15360 [Thermoguttaceae bacterium]